MGQGSGHRVGAHARGQPGATDSPSIFAEPDRRCADAHRCAFRRAGADIGSRPLVGAEQNAARSGAESAIVRRNACRKSFLGRYVHSKVSKTPHMLFGRAEFCSQAPRDLPGREAPGLSPDPHRAESRDRRRGAGTSVGSYRPVPGPAIATPQVRSRGSAE